MAQLTINTSESENGRVGGRAGADVMASVDAGQRRVWAWQHHLILSLLVTHTLDPPDLGFPQPSITSPYSHVLARGHHSSTFSILPFVSLWRHCDTPSAL